LAVTVWAALWGLAEAPAVHPAYSAMTALASALEAAVSNAGQSHDLKNWQRLPRRSQQKPIFSPRRLTIRARYTTDKRQSRIGDRERALHPSNKFKLSHPGESELCCGVYY
jgi:hypothetical protein